MKLNEHLIQQIFNSEVFREKKLKLKKAKKLQRKHIIFYCGVILEYKDAKIKKKKSLITFIVWP